MAFFEIRGGIPLRGSVTVSGAKNAALPIICASIMADEPCRIENLPDIEDVNRITEILSSMGAAITRPAPGVVVIDPRTIKSHSVTNEMAAKLRASYYMLGALLGKFRRAEIAQPGGCAIGQRIWRGRCLRDGHPPCRRRPALGPRRRRCLRTP